MNKFIILFLIVGLAASMVSASGFSVGLVEAKDSDSAATIVVIQEPAIMVTMAVATAVQAIMAAVVIAVVVIQEQVIMVVQTVVQVTMVIQIKR